MPLLPEGFPRATCHLCLVTCDEGWAGGNAPRDDGELVPCGGAGGVQRRGLVPLEHQLHHFPILQVYNPKQEFRRLLVHVLGAPEGHIGDHPDTQGLRVPLVLFQEGAPPRRGPERDPVDGVPRDLLALGCSCRCSCSAPARSVCTGRDRVATNEKEGGWKWGTWVPGSFRYTCGPLFSNIPRGFLGGRPGGVSWPILPVAWQPRSSPAGPE